MFWHGGDQLLTSKYTHIQGYSVAIVACFCLLYFCGSHHDNVKKIDSDLHSLPANHFLILRDVDMNQNNRSAIQPQTSHLNSKTYVSLICTWSKYEVGPCLFIG